MADYTITEEYGLTVVRGMMPIDKLAQLMGEDGDPEQFCASSLKHALNASLVIGTREAIDNAHQALGMSRHPPGDIHSLPPCRQLEEWRRRGEVGNSSLMLSYILAGDPIPSDAPLDPPYDAPDFERCVLLLRWVPGLRDHLDAAQWISPVWGLIVDNWDELEALVDQGDSERAILNARLRECRESASAG